MEKIYRATFRSPITAKRYSKDFQLLEDALKYANNMEKLHLATVAIRVKSKQ